MVDLNHVARDTLALRAYEQRVSNITVIDALASGLPQVFADGHLRAYSTREGVEAVVAGLGVQLYNRQRTSEGANTQSKVFSGESFTTVNNFGGAPRAAIAGQSVGVTLDRDIFVERGDVISALSSPAFLQTSVL